jgi:hypothetical protein
MTVRTLGGAGLWSTADSGSAFNTAMDPPTGYRRGRRISIFAAKSLPEILGKLPVPWMRATIENKSNLEHFRGL